MQKRSVLLSVGLFVVVVALSMSACSRAVSRYDAATLGRLRAKFQGVTVVVRVFTPRKHTKDWEGAASYITRTRASTVAYLQDKRIFGQVLMTVPQNPAGRVVIVDAVLEDYRIVSGAARFFGGALAGRSYMNYTVRLVDGTSGSPITSMAIKSSNNAYAASWVGGASDRSLPTDMGGIIGEFIIRTLEARISSPGPQPAP